MPSLEQAPSPCISVCKINPGEELCRGCWRTRDEIKGWKNASDAERLDLLNVLHQRREKAGGGSRRKPRRRRQKAIGY
ncbi:MAG TPA: DUF1289 domain-containing protein [Rhodospirillales bacterium]|nr:DUF1289 domain-containing protein [Rhodospirillales bacterium]